MKKKLILLFICAFTIRALLVNVAYHGDLNNNYSWGDTALKSGLRNFYEQKDWPYSKPNQPPLYILTFTLTSLIYHGISVISSDLNKTVRFFPSSFVWMWEENGRNFTLKILPIICDLAIGYLIYKFFADRSKNKLGFKLALVWLVNPITWYNSSIWGQTDAIVNLFGVTSLYFLLKKKLVYAFTIFTLSFLFKGSLIIFLPIFGIVAIYQKYKLRDWFMAIGLSIFIIIFTSVWFYPRIDLLLWLINLYINQIFPGEIGDLSANAFNFWYLINPGKVLDSTVYFGFPAKIWGYAITLLIVFLVTLRIFREKLSDRNILLILAIFALTVFLFMTRMHERYLYPFFPVATLLIGLEAYFLIPYLILSFTFLLNMYNLFWAPGIPFLESLLSQNQVTNILAIVNILSLVFVCVFIYLRTGSFIKKKD